MSINAIYEHYEGTNLQCSGVQLNRELVFVKDYGRSGALRYLDCSGVHHFFQPGSEYFVPIDVYDYDRNGTGVQYIGPGGVNDYIKLGNFSYLNEAYTPETGTVLDLTCDSGSIWLVSRGGTTVVSGRYGVDILATYGGSIHQHSSSDITLETDSGDITLTAGNSRDINLTASTVTIQASSNINALRLNNNPTFITKRQNSTDFTDENLISKISFTGSDSNSAGAYPTNATREWANIEVKNISWLTSHGVHFKINGWGLADDPDNKLSIMDAYWTGNKRIAFGSTHTDMYDNTGNWTNTPYSFKPWKLNDNLFGCDGTFTTSKDAIFNRNIYVGNTIWGDQNLTLQTDCGNITLNASDYIYLKHHKSGDTGKVAVMVNDSRMPLSTVDISGDLRVGLFGNASHYGLLTCAEYENNYYARLHGGLGGVMITSDSGDINLKTNNNTTHHVNISASNSYGGNVYVNSPLHLTNATLGAVPGAGVIESLTIEINETWYRIPLYAPY